MSIAKRIIDMAKSNLNAILERAAETADPRRRLASIPDADLEAELARRRSARLQEEKIADAKATIDGAGSSSPKAAPMPDRAERERAAREREARVRSERAKREQAAREAAASAGARRASGGPRPSSSSSSSRPSTGGATPRGRDPQLVRYYERLEVTYGSDFETVKSAYRRLMRKYHPDMHANKSPEARRAATEVAQALTQAYNELEKVLLGGPNRH